MIWRKNLSLCLAPILGAVLSLAQPAQPAH